MVTPWNCQLLSFLLLIGKSRLAPQREARVQIQASGRCIDFADAGFHCVPIFQCSNEGVIKTDAGGLFDPRCVNHYKQQQRKATVTMPSYSDYITNTNNSDNFAGRQKMTAGTMNTLMVSAALLREAKH